MIRGLQGVGLINTFYESIDSIYDSIEHLLQTWHKCDKTHYTNFKIIIIITELQKRLNVFGQVRTYKQHKITVYWCLMGFYWFMYKLNAVYIQPMFKWNTYLYIFITTPGCGRGQAPVSVCDIYSLQVKVLR